MSSESSILPNGERFLTKVGYTTRETTGVIILVVISCISLIAVVGLLIMICVSAFNTRASRDEHLFVRTHVAAYFLCILTCDICQAIGSITNATWIQRSAVEYGSLCTAQGFFKQIADVGTAVWMLVIAIHTFCLLVLELKLRKFVLWTTLLAGWCGILAIVMAGPGGLNTPVRGPFYGISGYWCWISDGYPAERIVLDYLYMFLSAFLSFIIYTLIFLRLRGNLLVDDRRFSFNFSKPLNEENSDNRSMTIAKQMLWYPVSYTILILPIACSRFSEWSGNNTPFEATIFSDSVFLLSGVVNVVLFSTSRRILPPESMDIGAMLKRTISKPKPVEPSSQTVEGGQIDPYYEAYEQANSISEASSETLRVEAYEHSSSSQSDDGSDHTVMPDSVAPLDIRKHRVPRDLELPDSTQNGSISRDSRRLDSLYGMYGAEEESGRDEKREDDSEEVYDGLTDYYNDVSLSTGGTVSPEVRRR